MPRIAPSVKRPPAACVIFFADGLSQAVLKRMLAAGELPNIDRLFARGGVEVENAIVCLPSLTYANAVSLITGLFPGHHGILGNQWFDPTTLEYRDYGGPLTYRRVNDDIRHATIYDLLDDHFTLNVQCHTRKGVKHTIDQDISGGILWGLGCYQTVDRRVGDVLPRIARVIDREGRWPIVWMNYFPGVDEIGHRFGPDSEQYAAAVRNVDAQVARIAAFAQQNAGVERLFLAFVTDHGMVASPGGGERQLRTEECIRSVVTKMSRNERSRAIQIGTDRSIRYLDTRFIEALRDDNPRNRVGLHCCPSKDCVILLSNCAGGLVSRTIRNGQKLYAYKYSEPNPRQPEILSDPLSYLFDSKRRAFLDREWHSSREWLNATAATDYPDFVPQIAELFDSPRAGERIVFALQNWSFRSRFVAGHGSCIADDMRVSHYYAGSGLPTGGTVHAARLVDVMPTLLDLLGHHDRLARIPSIDGVSIRRELEAAAKR